MIKTRAKARALFKRKRDNYARKLKREKLIKYLQSELRSCTTHGLPYIVNPAIHWMGRVFWAVNFIVCVGIIVMLLTSQYSRYINSPVVMSVEMDYFNWNVSYPAITLCPTSKIDQELFSALVNETRVKTGKNLHSYYWSIGTVSLENLDQLAVQTPDVVKLLSTKDYAQIAAILFENLDNSSFTTNIIEPISIQPALTEMGMCHVINSNVAVFHNPTKWKDEATTYVKNNIEISAHDVDFFTEIMNYAEVFKVYVHSPDEIATSTSPSFTYDVEGLLLFGYQVWVAKISDTLQNVPINIRKCRYIHEPINKRYPVYSYNHCMLDCRIKMIITLCGCVPHFYKNLDHEKICDFTELLCVIRYKNEIIRLAPSNDTVRKFRFRALPRSSSDCNCLGSCESQEYLKDRESFLAQEYMSRLRIGVSTFPRYRVKREFIFSIHDMILKTGGVINLCIGSSVISIMELIMTVIRIPLGNLADWVVNKIK